jgi:hypothetical protein
VAVDAVVPAAREAVNEGQVVGVQTVMPWREGMTSADLPPVYRDIVGVIDDAPGPVRAKQIVPRIGLPTQTSKIETTRSKMKRLVERGWLDEATPGLFTPSARRHRARDADGGEGSLCGNVAV